MIYPNTQPSGVVGGDNGQDNKRRLQQLLAHNGAAPLFGSSGRSASVASLPSVGAPALSFNPFLKMLSGHPGETLNNLPTNNPLQGFVGSSVPTTSGAGSSGLNGFNPGPDPGNVGVRQPGNFQAPNPFDNAAPNYAPGGHFNDFNGVGGAQPGLAPQGAGSPIAGAPPNLYHTLLQLAMYGNQ